MALATANTTQPNTTESLHEIVNNGVRRAIFEDDEKDPLNILLYDLIHGSTSPTLAAAEFLTFARDSEDTESCFSDLAAQTISLASEYPFLQPHLVGLIASIMQSAPASFPSEMRICFVKKYAKAIGDTTQSNYGILFEEEQRRRRPSLVQEHVNLNRFIARLLSALGEPGKPKEGLTHVNDALFILSTALEGHASSHQLPDVDVPAAAQYMIHAGELIFNECKNGTGQDLAKTSPLWATRGKLWTGPPGLSRERWNFWRGRFEEAAESEENVAEETKKTAGTAVRAMAHAES
ncbi:MAG: hypothetical protein HETSPECPRED_001559 [Heterodermia speciosa]|uniref:Uncharacterized protein n=1 Tax=Heterodermia speciosa TaxID=116794 RepID=A0A8H3PE72_9LECA|nr:MAG: hypothetical protein HETSPECPRED_001559 [Heterodermia speciosa]